ncbi:hypothetical protein R8Z50_33280 [Longispora sp. K20-0274]|uniref:hypothetical protein n=1 Tax=Longispora sp. K20-0274 TaxID=3088255 RepID=UPI00399B78D9
MLGKQPARRVAVFGAALALVGVSAAIGGQPAAEAAADTSAVVTICAVPPQATEHELTVRVTRRVADRLLRETPSYPGRCAAYGTAGPLGLRTYATVDTGRTEAVGYVFPATLLDSLPTTMSDRKHCFDVNGDGATDEHAECSVGHEYPLDLPSVPGVPLTWALANYMPHGHAPEGVYTSPHLDLHFYLQPKAERDAIRPGPCGLLVNCEDFARGMIPLPAANMPKDYLDVGIVEVAMGNHLIDPSTPEWHGQPFSQSFMYGVYDGKVSFLEPMISLDLLRQLKAGLAASGCTPVKQPQSWQTPGSYPTTVCVRYRANRDDFTVSMEGFRAS